MANFYHPESVQHKMICKQEPAIHFLINILYLPGILKVAASAMVPVLITILFDEFMVGNNTGNLFFIGVHGWIPILSESVVIK